MRINIIGFLAIILVVLSMAGCASPAGNQVSLGKEFSLSIGQKVAINGENIALKFIDVTQDSRCPTGVQCIRAGDVTCLVEVTVSGLSPYSLNLTTPGPTGPDSRQSFDGHEIVFKVEPYPAAGKQIAKSDYRLIMTVTRSLFSLPELKYKLIANFSDVFWCDPDLYPIARPGQEEINAAAQYPAIRADAAEFAAILRHLGLPNQSDYTDAQKLQIYRAHKELAFAVQTTASANIYDFTLRVGRGQGERIQGTITQTGGIKVTKREPSVNTCPICLTAGTLIDTPAGAVPVESLRKGMAVWTIERAGKTAAAEVLEVTKTPVPASFLMTRLTLSDGRAITASPGHPTAAGRALGDYRVGDTLDGAVVVAVESIAYEGGFTYDLLPSGGTGLYRANGITLKSTLATVNSEKPPCCQ